MARKNKRTQQRKPQRGRPGPGPRPASASPSAGSAAAVPAAQGATPPSVSPVPAPRPTPRQVRGRLQQGPLPSQDAAIPLERVPYFRSDLRRIAITGGTMLVILLAGSVVLRNLLGA